MGLHCSDKDDHFKAPTQKERKEGKVCILVGQHITSRPRARDIPFQILPPLPSTLTRIKYRNNSFIALSKALVCRGRGSVKIK